MFCSPAAVSFIWSNSTALGVLQKEKQEVGSPPVNYNGKVARAAPLLRLNCNLFIYTTANAREREKEEIRESR